MEELWIHGALNVCVNDQSQLAELEKRGREGRKERQSDGKKKKKKNTHRSGEEPRRKGGR